MTLQIETSRFGALDIEESRIISIPDGILGFSDKRFILLTPRDAAPFCWLQSVDAPEVAFVAVDPVAFFPVYSFRLTKDELEKLQMAEGEEVVPLVFITMAANPAEITANLMGPVVINPAAMIGKQIVLEGTKYNTKVPIFGEGEIMAANNHSEAVAKVAADLAVP